MKIDINQTREKLRQVTGLKIRVPHGPPEERRRWLAARCQKAKIVPVYEGEMDE